MFRLLIFVHIFVLTNKNNKQTNENTDCKTSTVDKESTEDKEETAT